jgi:quinolinate synthase
MGITNEQMPVWDPYEEDLGGNTENDRSSRVILWKGHCSVHQMFRPNTSQFREISGYQDPGAPECPQEVNDIADVSGSTGKIIRRSKQRRRARSGPSAPSCTW